MAKLYFYYSAMNAGKTTTLLQSNYNYNERGMQTLLFLPDFDNRYEVGKITSRIGLKSAAHTFDANFDFHAFVKQRQRRLKKLNCILLDEAQFLTEGQVRQLTEVVDFLDIPVLAYGLRSDFRAQPFEGSKALLTLADELIEIKTICHCGRKAIMTLRIDEQGEAVRDGGQVEIGGNERYIAVCRRHFTQGKSDAVTDSPVMQKKA